MSVNLINLENCKLDIDEDNKKQNKNERPEG